MNPIAACLDVAVGLLVLTGAMFALVGAWGLARLPNFFLRLHAPTKVSTLGIGCTLVASILSAIPSGFRPHELLITLFVFVTAPVAAHLLAKAAMALAEPVGFGDSSRSTLESGARDSRDTT